MKLSDFNLKDPVHSRLCRFIIHRYFGQFLERNLVLDQLSLSLISGSLNIHDVNINVHYVNELLTSLNVPLKLIDGFIGGIAIEVPWMSLVSDATRIRINDLQLTFQAKEFVKLDDKDLVSSMIGSVVESFVSSTELAKSFYENEQQMGDSGDMEGQDGVMAFTKIIDAVASRLCLEFNETTIRLENPPKTNSKTCTAMEIRIQEIKFMDEQMKNCQQEGKNAETITSQPQGMGSITNLNKFLNIKGVTFYTDVFSQIDDQPLDPNNTSLVVTSMYIRREKQKQKSPTHSSHDEQRNPELFMSTMSSASANFHSCYSNFNGPDYSSLPTTIDNHRVMNLEPELMSNPIKFAEILDESNMVVRIRNCDSQADQMENKIEVEIFFKRLNVFITPTQIDIIKRFFSSLTISQTPEKASEHGKRMKKSDYDAMVKNIEETSFQSNQIHGIGVRGNWNQREDFHEFDSVNLEDNRYSRKFSEQLKEGYKSIKNETGKKESTHLKATFGIVLIYIPHHDLMSSENVQKLEHSNNIIDKLLAESESFFNLSTQFKPLSNTPLYTFRNQLDNLYNKDHLRFVGSSVVWNHQIDKNIVGEHMSAKLIVSNADCIEYLTNTSNPLNTQTCHIPLLDFSNFENIDQDPHLKLIFTTSSAERGKSKIHIYVGNCQSELDLSLIDRISDLVVPRPFFDNPSFGRGRLDSLTRVDNFQLSDELFNTVSTVEKKEPTLMVINCMDWNLNFRVPKADMRDPSEAKIPYQQRNIHAEYLALRLKSASVEIPIGDEYTSIELLCSEITGDFCGLSPEFECSDDDQRFLYGTQASIDDKVHLKFEYDLRNRSLKTSGTRILAPGVDDMTRSISLSVMQSLPQREGPFSQTRLSFSQNHEEDNDLIQAGTREEMMAFGNTCLQQSASIIHIDIPILRFYIPNHSSLEVLYNRLVNDLALWQPRAPALRPQSSQLKINALSDEIFQECRADGISERYTDDDELMDERSHPSCDYTEYERNKMHNLSLMLNIKKGTLLMGTVVNENDVKKGLGQISVDLSDAQLFTVTGYHGQLNETFFYFTTNTVSIGQKNFSCTIPKSVYQKEFGKWFREDTQLETIGISDEFSNHSKGDVIGVAVHLHNRSDSNVKDILLAIAMRNTCVQLRPFRDAGHVWVSQLANLFTLKDYEIPGYKLPLVTTDLHVHLENVVLAYDHSWINPSSLIRLRLVLDQTNISSAVIQDMNISKFVCIFEGSRLFISSQKKSTDGVSFDESRKFNSISSNTRREKHFIQVVDVGLFQLEVLLSLSITCDLNGRRAPMVEIRCSNDIIKAWACSDSLVSLINIVTEISNSDKIMTIPPEVEKEEDQRQESEDDASSETAISASYTANSNNPLPKLVEMKMKRMLESAIKEPSSGNIRYHETNPCGTDALKEFSRNYSFSQAQNKEFPVDREDESSDRNRAYSLSTDDEFCMVDDIIGSGITSASGEPCIKYIGSRKKDGDSGIIIDPQYFRVPNDWRGDGLGALLSHFPHPLIRYLVRDFSIRLHLYGGSDLNEDPPKPRNYSVDEYREGKGRNQKVTSEMMGGKHRDQSVSVVLDLDKITFLYQMFNKDAPLMCTTLFSVYNVTLLDKLQLSSIKEMMYQYNNAGQPRRTCAPMLAIRMVETHTCEGKMRVSMLPVKFNIDQDTMEFLEDFIYDVTSTISFPSDVAASASIRPVMGIPSEHRAKSAEDNILYPALTKHNSLNLEPLLPSPVAPLSPLGDLSFLENRSSGGSPVKRPLIDAPLTASAVSIGDLFVTKPNASKRVLSSESDISSQSSSPDLIRADPVSEDEPFLENLKLEGDWNSTTEIRFHDLSSSSVDQILMQSTMKGPPHPDMHSEDSSCVQEDLIDTSSNFDMEIDGDKSTICGEDSSTNVSSNIQRKFSCEGDDAIRGSTFFKEFVFSPAVSIYVDYHGKNKINMEKSGAVLGVLKGIGQLNRTEIVLKEIIHRNGLLGVGRCVNFAINEWADDIIAKLPNVLATYGPISPLVQIGKGVMDLFWLPVVELRKEDGHVVKGIQKGMGSFSLSSAAGIVGMAQTVVGVVQIFAESVLHEVQPIAPYLNQRNRRAVAARAAAPTDLRHGMQLAYDIVADGVRQTRSDLELAAQEDRASGHSSLRSVLRFATPAVIRPLVVSSQISYQILGGLRNQLRPDVYQDERHKWRDEEIPGGSGQF